MRGAVAPRANVRIHLGGLNGVRIPGDLYAKVMEVSTPAASEDARLIVVFTSVPPELKSFLQSALASQTL